VDDDYFLTPEDRLKVAAVMLPIIALCLVLGWWFG
jgi:hypothetical protein